MNRIPQDPHHAVDDLLASLDPLPYPRRMRELAERARASADRGELRPLLDELARRGPYGERLAAVAAHVGQDTGYLEARLADPDTVVRGHALRAAASLPITDAAFETALHDAPAAIRRELIRAIVAGRRTGLADRLVEPYRERWGEREAARLLPGCGPRTVARLLPDLFHAVGGWRRLSARHPDAVLDTAERELAALPQALREPWWQRYAPAVAGPAPARPDRVLDLLERYGAGPLPTPVLHRLAHLASAGPGRTLRLLLEPRHAALLRGPGLPSPALRSLARRDRLRGPLPELTALARAVAADPQQLARLLRALPPSRRGEIYDALVGEPGGPTPDPGTAHGAGRAAHAAVLGVAGSGAAVPGAAGSGAAVPGAAGWDAAVPGAAVPGVAGSGAAVPDAVGPGLTGPRPGEAPGGDGAEREPGDASAGGAGLGGADPAGPGAYATHAGTGTGPYAAGFGRSDAAGFGRSDAAGFGRSDAAGSDGAGVDVAGRDGAGVDVAGGDHWPEAQGERGAGEDPAAGASAAWADDRVMDLLPRTRRVREARRLLARRRERGADRFAVLAATAHLPAEEAWGALLAATRSSAAEDRARAWPLLIACAARSDGSAAVPRLLVELERLRNEQDPVRSAALAALRALHPRRFTDGDVPSLDRVATDAVAARDSSAATRGALGALAVALLREGAVTAERQLVGWALRTLVRLSGDTGGADLGRLDRSLRRGQEHEVLDALRPWLEAGAEKVDHGLTFALARAVGPRRAAGMPELQELLWQAVQFGNDATTRTAIGLWLEPPATRDERVGRLLALEPSAAVLEPVLSVLTRRRTDLLDTVLGDTGPYGRFRLPGSHWLPPVTRDAARWLPRQQAAAARLMERAASDTSLRPWERASALARAARIPGTGAAVVRRWIGSPDVRLGEAALAALPWTDRPGDALPTLLEHVGEDNARVAAYAAGRAARFVRPSLLAGRLRAVLLPGAGGGPEGERPRAKVTSRKEAARLAATRLPVQEAAALLAEAYEHPRIHPDVRAACVAFAPRLLGDERAWQMVACATTGPAAVRHAVLRARPLDLPEQLRKRYALLVTAVCDTSDREVAEAGYAALAHWAPWSPDAAGVLAAAVTDLTNRETWRAAADGLATLVTSVPESLPTLGGVLTTLIAADTRLDVRGDALAVADARLAAALAERDAGDDPRRPGPEALQGTAADDARQRASGGTSGAPGAPGAAEAPPGAPGTAEARPGAPGSGGTEPPIAGRGVDAGVDGAEPPIAGRGVDAGMEGAEPPVTGRWAGAGIDDVEAPATGGGVDAGVDRDRPARRRVEHLVARLAAGAAVRPETGRAAARDAAELLADHDAFVPAAVRLLGEALDWDAGPADLGGQVFRLARLHEGRPALAERTATAVRRRLATAREPGTGSALCDAAARLAGDGGHATGLLATVLTEAGGRRAGWPAPWREQLRRLRRHPVPDVRDAALSVRTAEE